MITPFHFLQIQLVLVALWKILMDKSFVVVSVSKYWRCLHWDFVQAFNDGCQPVCWFWMAGGPIPHWSNLGSSEERDLPICKSIPWIAKPLITGSGLCVDSQRRKEPLRTYQKMGQLYQNAFLVNKSFSWIAELLMMGFFICVGSKRG